jgi:GNAT superfamily N-acetyltransferase
MGEISMVAVDPDFQGHGIGSALTNIFGIQASPFKATFDFRYTS